MAILVNSLVNIFVVNDPAGLHHRTTSWVFACIVAILGTVLAAHWLPCAKGCVNALIAGLLGGAVMASLLDAFTHSMAVQNQFAVIFGENSGVYFNAADVMMYCGFIFLALQTAKLTYAHQVERKMAKCNQEC